MHFILWLYPQLSSTTLPITIWHTYSILNHLNYRPRHTLHLTNCTLNRVLQIATMCMHASSSWIQRYKAAAAAQIQRYLVTAAATVCGCVSVCVCAGVCLRVWLTECVSINNRKRSVAAAKHQLAKSKKALDTK